MNADYLFVYGTLRKNGGAALQPYLARHCSFTGQAFFQGRLFSLGAYPGLVASNCPEDRVVGELYQLPDATQADLLNDILACLDAYEECSADDPEPHEYSRVMASVSMEDNTKVNAWVYLYNRDCSGLTQITSGDFLSKKPSCFNDGVDINQL